MTDVVRYGVDTSGRPILMSPQMREWWERVVDDLGYEPVIVQGAWMSRIPGGGARASAGYHDKGGCLDLRTWDHTPAQAANLVRVLREWGAGAWRRDERHGMDPHLHLVAGWDADLAAGAATQWRQYLAGRDGLTSNGPDYEWRPTPLVLTPPEDDMADYADQLDGIDKKLDALLKGQAKAQRQNAAIRGKVTKLVQKGSATRADLAELLAAIDNDTEES